MKRVLFIGTLMLVTAFPVASSETKASMTSSEITMEEYKALRAEILQCSQNRFTILSLGFPAVGALLAAGIGFARHKQYWILAAFVVGVGVALTSLYVVDLWMEETHRMARASYHNYHLELKLNKLFPTQDPPLEWEERIRNNDDYKRIVPPNELGTPRVFLWLSVVSALSGLALFWRATLEIRRQYLTIPILLIVIAFIAWVVYPRFEKMGDLGQIWAMTPK